MLDSIVEKCHNSCVFSMAFLSTSSRLVSSRWQGLAAPAFGPGFGGGYVTYPGAEAVRLSADVALLDPEARVPYAARGTDWVSYESVESATEKVGGGVVLHWCSSGRGYDC